MPRRPPSSAARAASRVLLALAVATAAARSVAAQTRSASGAISGTVFLDRNANGVRDAGEPGAPGVRVSNQDTVVVTDGAGAFRLRDGGHGVVYVTVPDIAPDALRVCAAIDRAAAAATASARRSLDAARVVERGGRRGMCVLVGNGVAVCETWR